MKAKKVKKMDDPNSRPFARLKLAEKAIKRRQRKEARRNKLKKIIGFFHATTPTAPKKRRVA